VAKKKRKKTRRPAGKPAASATGTKPGPTTTAEKERAAVLSEAAQEDREDGGRKGGRDARTKERRGRGTADAPSVSNRQARKEAARRERERRIRAARRRARARRAIRAGLVLGVAAAVGTFVWFRTTESRRIRQTAEQATEALGCRPIQSFTAEGRQHLQPGQPLPEYQTTPATSGPHNGVPYQGPPVIEGEVTPQLEAQLVHNLEHAYVVMYYRPSGDGALPVDVRERLADLARDEDKVILAPYPRLKEGTSLAFAAWTRLQTCPTIPESQAAAAVDVANGFIDQFRGGGEAPEPQGA
jgi:uncharacterized protein DUF3105